MRIVYPRMLRRPALWNTNTLLECREISQLAVAMSSQTGYMRNLIEGARVRGEQTTEIL